MTQPSRELPASKISTARAVLSLTFRLSAEVESGRITEKIFREQVQIHTGDSGLLLPAAPDRTITDLKSGMMNLCVMALGASALSVDETLGDVFGAADPNADTYGLRVMVNQLRNAFAHNPWQARWVIFPKYQKSFLVELRDGTSFTFNATSLNGEQIKPEDVGGLEFWVKVLNHCEHWVAGQ